MAPEQQYRRAVCTYGLVLDLLDALQILLRSRGEHAAGDQIAQLLREFLASREQPPSQPTLLRTKDQTLPKSDGKPSRRLPGTGVYDHTS